MKKFLALLLSAALLTSLLAGCGKTADPQGDDTQTITQEEDLCLRLTGLSSDTEVLTVDGQSVTAGQLAYWLAVGLYNYSYYYGTEEPDWETEVSDGMTLEQYFLNDAAETTILYQVIRSQVSQRGITLSQEEQETLDNLMADMAEELGTSMWEQDVAAGSIVEDDYTEEEKAAWIAENGAVEAADALRYWGVSEEVYLGLAEVTRYAQKLQNTLFNEGGELAPTDETILDYVQQNHGTVYMAKHILFSTMDETGAALEDEEKETVRQQAQEVLDQIRAGGDFDALMQEYSEDPGLAYYPDGYLAYPGQMVTEFEEAALALEVGQVSDLVESSYGYHIIQRLEVDTDTLNKTFREEYISSAFSGLESQWREEVEVTYTDAYYDISLPNFFANLNALREELAGTEEDVDTEANADTEAGADTAAAD